jgi:arylsulfatase A-like enzyme
MSASKMLPAWRPALAAAVAAAAVSLGLPALAETPARPNVLVIVADDLGFSDTAPFGGEIRTPNLQALADNGVRLTGFHTAPTCSPTRAMLLTGADNHEVGLGSMAEVIAHQPLVNGRPGYEGHLNGRAATLPQRLQAAGYTTLMSGKWHLGMTEATSPKAMGFDHSFALLEGGHDHYGDDQSVTLVEANAGSTYRENGKLSTYPVGQYSADVFASRMIGYLKDAKTAGKPFFAYLTFTEPHWPLQAPEADVARYKGKYADGYEALRLRRLARMKDLGLIDKDVQPSPFLSVKPWADLTPEEQARASRKMEIYAAMVDRMDQNIGRVVSALKANGQYDDTVVIFLSDNGAEAQALDGPFGMPPEKVAALGFDNSMDNLGRRRSYTSYGPAWALAATAPSRDVKGTTFEGGIRTPAIVAGRGIKAPGRISKAPLHVMDVTPTVLALAGVSPEATKSELPIRGASWGALLAGEDAAVHPADTVWTWELFFQRAVRRGDWKAVYAPIAPLAKFPVNPAKSAWLLFNLKDDPGETRNLAAERPDVLKAMVGAWDDYAARSGVVLPPAEAPAQP